MEKKVPFIVAELGTSHGGDEQKTRELIAAAAEAGADCVKCQIIFAAEILHPKTGNVLLPGGEMPLFELFKALERDQKFYEMVKNEAEKRSVRFLAAPYGPRSAALLKNLSPDAVKIASPELNYTGLVKELASWGLPVFLSTGVSTLGDIEEAIAAIAGASPVPPDITLLHCVTAYPAPPGDYNLRVLPNLGGVFGCRVGLSDHSLDPLLVPVLGYAMGATVIEKHFCLSRGGPGLDDPIALTPEAFKQMCDGLNRVSSLGAGEIIGEMEREYSRELVAETLGDGVKALPPSEKPNYGRTNRSIHAVCDIAEGETVTKDMIAVLRTEKNLRPGLHPRWESLILGRKARNGIPAGEGVTFEDV